MADLPQRAIQLRWALRNCECMGLMRRCVYRNHATKNVAAFGHIDRDEWSGECLDRQSWAFTPLRLSSRLRPPFMTPCVVPAIRVGPRFGSWPFRSRCVVNDVQQRPSLSRR